MRSPFSPENKRSAVAIESPDRMGPDGKGMVSIYVKGAPELLLKFCSKLSMGSVDRTLELGE
jgi:magnesium-transporting ATPase (P-type)